MDICIEQAGMVVLAAAMEEIMVIVVVMQDLDMPEGMMEEEDGHQVKVLEIYSAEVVAVVQDETLVAVGVVIQAQLEE